MDISIRDLADAGIKRVIQKNALPRAALRQGGTSLYEKANVPFDACVNGGSLQIVEHSTL